MTAKTPPSGQTVQAHMTVHDAAAAIGFYVKAFGAEELFRLVEPAGRVGEHRHPLLLSHTRVDGAHGACARARAAG